MESLVVTSAGRSEWDCLAILEGERLAMVNANTDNERITGIRYGIHSAKTIRSITRAIMEARCTAQGIEYR